MSLRMPCENIEHPGSAGACQSYETGIAWVMATVVGSVTCSSADFFDLTPNVCHESDARLSELTRKDREDWLALCSWPFDTSPRSRCRNMRFSHGNQTLTNSLDSTRNRKAKKETPSSHLSLGHPRQGFAGKISSPA